MLITLMLTITSFRYVDTAIAVIVTEYEQQVDTPLYMPLLFFHTYHAMPPHFYRRRQLSLIRYLLAATPPRHFVAHFTLRHFTIDGRPPRFADFR